MIFTISASVLSSKYLSITTVRRAGGSRSTASRSKTASTSEKDGHASASPPPASAPAEKKPNYAGYEYNVKISLLRQGSSGPQVKNLQTLLNAAGFDCGAADGEFGPKTAAALLAFQRAHGLGADGEFGGQSFTALWNS